MWRLSPKSSGGSVYSMPISHGKVFNSNTGEWRIWTNYLINIIFMIQFLLYSVPLVGKRGWQASQITPFIQLQLPPHHLNPMMYLFYGEATDHSNPIFTWCLQSPPTAEAYTTMPPSPLSPTPLPLTTVTKSGYVHRIASMWLLFLPSSY